MTKTAHEYPPKAMAFHASWRSEAPAKKLAAPQEDTASSEFIADLAERIAALCAEAQDGAARDDPYGAPPMLDRGGVILFATDGHIRSLAEIEADVIRLAITQYHGRISEAARRLHIGRSTLYRKLGEIGAEQTRQ